MEILKLKKILSSLICLTLLAVLTCTMSIKFGGVSLSKPRTEIAQANLNSDLNLSFILEERDDVNDNEHFIALAVELISFQHLLNTSGFPVFSNFFTYETVYLKDFLYLKFRSLRL